MNTYNNFISISSSAFTIGTAPELKLEFGKEPISKLYNDDNTKNNGILMSSFTNTPSKSDDYNQSISIGSMNSQNYFGSNKSFNNYNLIKKKKIIDDDFEKDINDFDKIHSNLKKNLSKFKKLSDIIEDINIIIESYNLNSDEKINELRKQMKLIKSLDKNEDETEIKYQKKEKILLDKVKIYNNFIFNENNNEPIYLFDKELLKKSESILKNKIYDTYDNNENNSIYLKEFIVEADQESYISNLSVKLKDQEINTLKIKPSFNIPLKFIFKIIPNNIKRIIFKVNINDNITIPDTIEEINIEGRCSIGTSRTEFTNYDKKIIIPENLKSLSINFSTYQLLTIYNFSYYLEELYITLIFNNSIRIPTLPKNLKKLVFLETAGISGECNINKLILPTGIEYVELPENYNHSIKDFPKTIKYLMISNYTKYEEIPESVTHLKLFNYMCPNGFEEENINNLPKNIKYLNIRNNYSNDLSIFNKLSDNIEELILDYNFSLNNHGKDTETIIKFPKNLKRLYTPLELLNHMENFFDDFYFRYKFEIIVLNCEEFKLLNKNDMHVNLLTLLSH